MKNLQTQPANSASARPDAVSAAKLDLYSQAYKVMMSGQTSLRPSYEGFVARLENTRNNEEILYISGGRLEYALELFRQGYAIHGGDMPELDRNVLDVIDAGNSLMAKRAGQEPIEGNQKENDSPDRATDGTSPLPSGYEALFAAMDLEETLLSNTGRVNRKNGWHGSKRQAIHWAFIRNEVLLKHRIFWHCLSLRKMPSMTVKRTTRAILFFPVWKSHWQRSGRAYVNARSEEVEGLENYPAVYRVLTSMAGSYRDLRQNRTLSDLSALNKKYNEAIKANNRVSMLIQ